MAKRKAAIHQVRAHFMSNRSVFHRHSETSPSGTFMTSSDENERDWQKKFQFIFGQRCAQIRVKCAVPFQVWIPDNLWYLRVIFECHFGGWLRKWAGISADGYLWNHSFFLLYGRNEVRR
ncbi:hypothetical protein CEXT_785171 [Caerostris extrusa]|uniref:Uncharacterized protein n=1 Tax=Caerostris extrusa TaxID=172846 RepID=A0AAV4YCP4_CAEEX|nr:hypothetical protein CEXT_785171 [Caerostris extrusa]